MLNYFKFIEILISIQSLFLSTMIPLFGTLPFNNILKNSFEFPITLQVPIIILLALIFEQKIVFSALTIYLFLGLFIIPVFYEGGSLGYLLSPNFGYLIGYYPLIKKIGNSNNKSKIYMADVVRNGIIAIIYMHLTGILYSFIQLIYYKQINLFLYNLGNFSLGMIGYHILMLFPLLLLTKPINYFKLNR